MKYLKEILRSRSGASSKRLISLLLVINILGISWVSVFTSYDVEEYIFASLVMLAGGVIGLTTSEKIFTKKNDDESQQTEDLQRSNRVL